MNWNVYYYNKYLFIHRRWNDIKNKLIMRIVKKNHKHKCYFPRFIVNGKNKKKKKNIFRVVVITQ